MSNKIERELNGPSWTEVILGAVLSLVLGTALAVMYMVLKPVETVKELPKEPAPDVVYYIQGSHDSSKARQAAAKQKLFLQGRSVELNEDELNLLAAPNVTTPVAKPVPGKPGQPPAGPPAEKALTAGTPNFRMQLGVLQIAVPIRVSALGFDERVVVQARGGFAKRGETFVFEPTVIYLGSCPLQRLPALRGYLLNRFLAAASVPGELEAAWRKLDSVSVEGSTLHLTMQ